MSNETPHIADKAEHRVAHDTGRELVCTCGTLLSNYGMTRSTVSLFAQHIRDTSSQPDAAYEQAREMRAFVAGWFAHARNPERLLVEDAWRAHRIGDLCPACLRKPCACPHDDSAVRAIFERLAVPEQEADRG